MSKPAFSPDNIPLPFNGESISVVQPYNDRVQHVASFMIDKTEPEHIFSLQTTTPEQAVVQQVIVSTGTPRYDAVLDPEASEASQNQGFGRMPEYRKPEVIKPKKQRRTSTRPIESRFTGHGQEPPIFDPSTAVYPEKSDSTEAGPGRQEFLDVKEKLEIQNIMNKHGVSLEEARNIRAANIERNKNS